MAETKKSVEEAIALKLATKRLADADYMKKYRPAMLRKFKDEPLEVVHGSQAYANYFGSVYTVLFNLVPVTIRFDGTEQKFPKSVAQFLRRKIMKTTAVNIPQVVTEESKSV